MTGYIESLCAEILRAAKILHQMKLAHEAEKGAIGLEGEMIDAPMIKQVSCLQFNKTTAHISFLRQKRSSLLQRQLVWLYLMYHLLLNLHTSYYENIYEPLTQPHYPMLWHSHRVTNFEFHHHYPTTIKSQASMASDLQRYVSDNVLTVS